MHFSGNHIYYKGETLYIATNFRGFTTYREQSLSSLHCTDVGNPLGIQSFLVNGNDPDTLARVFKMAVEWSTHLMTDVIINLTC
jgi:2-oxoglutarate dehydrogenase complex dehydrogenase (E1) component-like enzyme